MRERPEGEVEPTLYDEAELPDEEGEGRFIDSYFDSPPELVVEYSAEQLSRMNMEAYGYGYWMRFTTLYPTRLANGLQEDFVYHVSRLTQRRDYASD